MIRVMESGLVDELTEQVLRRPEMERVVEHMPPAPQVVEAVTHTRRRSPRRWSPTCAPYPYGGRLAERTVRGWLRRPSPEPVVTEPEVPYAGVATRAVALAIDVVVAHVIVFAGGGILPWSSRSSRRAPRHAGQSARRSGLDAIVVAYFVLFWSTAGQTPGMRLMNLRVITQRGSIGRGTVRVRVLGLGLARSCRWAGLRARAGRRAARRGLHDSWPAPSCVLRPGRWCDFPPGHWTASWRSTRAA